MAQVILKDLKIKTYAAAIMRQDGRVSTLFASIECTCESSLLKGSGIPHTINIYGEDSDEFFETHKYWQSITCDNCTKKYKIRWIRARGSNPHFVEVAAGYLGDKTEK